MYFPQQSKIMSQTVETESYETGKVDLLFYIFFTLLSLYPVHLVFMNLFNSNTFLFYKECHYFIKL